MVVRSCVTTHQQLIPRIMELLNHDVMHHDGMDPFTLFQIFLISVAVFPIGSDSRAALSAQRLG